MGPKRSRKSLRNKSDEEAAAVKPSKLHELPLKSEALQCLKALLPFQDCTLVLENVQIPCHKLKLSEVSTVLREIFSNLPDGQVCRLDGEKVESIAPMLELAYGGLAFSISHRNLEAALYCHDKYDCEGLHSAAEEYMEWAVNSCTPAPGISLAVFKASSRFGITSSYEKSAKILAGMLHHIKSDESSTIHADMMALERRDLDFLDLERRKLLEKFLVTVTHQFDIDQLQTNLGDNSSGQGGDDTHYSGFKVATADLDIKLKNIVSKSGLEVFDRFHIEREFGHGSHERYM